MSSLPISEKSRQKQAAETAKYDTLQKLRHQISAGWPEHRLNLDICLRPYYHHDSEVTYQVELLLKGQQIIVPSALQLEMYKILQKGHLRIEKKTKSQVRQSVIWSNINADIRDTISKCEACQQYKNHQGTEPLMNHEIPDKPWKKVGTDLFKIQRITYLIVVDFYFKCFEINKLLNNTSPKVINHMKAMCARHGIPKLVFSDYGPELTSLEFRKFSANRNFEHDPEF